MRTLHKTLIDNQAALTSYNSLAIDASYLVSGSLIINTDTPSSTCSVSLDVSDDASNILGGPVNWVSLDSVNISGAGNYIIPYKELSYQWIRASFTQNENTTYPTDTITTVADVASSLMSKEFVISGTNGRVGFYYTVGGVGDFTIVPGVGIYFNIDIAANDSADTVASNTLTVISSQLTGVSFGLVNNVITAYHTGTPFGSFNPAADVSAAPTGFTFQNNLITGNVTVNFKGLGV